MEALLSDRTSELKRFQFGASIDKAASSDGKAELIERAASATTANHHTH